MKLFSNWLKSTPAYVEHFSQCLSNFLPFLFFSCVFSIRGSSALELATLLSVIPEESFFESPEEFLEQVFFYFDNFANFGNFLFYLN